MTIINVLSLNTEITDVTLHTMYNLVPNKLEFVKSCSLVNI